MNENDLKPYIKIADKAKTYEDYSSGLIEQMKKDEKDFIEKSLIVRMNREILHKHMELFKKGIADDIQDWNPCYLAGFSGKYGQTKMKEPKEVPKFANYVTSCLDENFRSFRNQDQTPEDMATVPKIWDSIITCQSDLMKNLPKLSKKEESSDIERSSGPSGSKTTDDTFLAKSSKSEKND